jgi:hypothetical protein
MSELAIIQHRGDEVSALIGGAGKPAARRFLEFFTLNNRNKNTRAAYARVAAFFLRRCEGQGIGELGRPSPPSGALNGCPAGRPPAPPQRERASLAAGPRAIIWIYYGI